MISEEVKKSSNASKPCSDHKGNRYPSGKDMCDFYGVQYGTFMRRINSGWILKDALETPVGYECTDHLGNTYASVNAKCTFYNIPRDTYSRRIEQYGWSEEKALTTPTRWTDEEIRILKDKYPQCGRNISELLVNHNTDAIKDKAISLGLKKLKKIALVRTDHLGNIFETGEELLDYYGITISCYYSRQKAGLSLEDTLTAPPLHKTSLFHGYKITRGKIINGVPYYRCECLSCGQKDFLNPRDMRAGCPNCGGGQHE